MNKDKQLKERAIQIKGKDYVCVSDRIIYFNENYPEGCIESKIIEHEKGGQIVIKTYIRPEGYGENKRVFTGYSQEIEGEGYINKTSALENAETSAVGRALAMMGIGVIDSIASMDEINKATNRSTYIPKPNYYNKPKPETSVDKVKKILREKGANSPEEAIKTLSDLSGITLNSLQELTEDKAKEILNFIIK